MILAEGFLIGPGEIVFDSSWVDGLGDNEVLKYVRDFAKLAADEDLIQAHNGGIGNFNSIEEFYQYQRDLQVKEASRHMKLQLTQERRRNFAANRDAISLALIDRDGYVCALPGCDKVVDLAIDHMVPMSRGGGDELSNLRFLCKRHNSAKGDSLIA